MLRILIIGDIVGKIGRKALTQKLPALRKKYNPDLVVANCENAAHGAGITPKIFQEILSAGVDFCTSGNHIWDKYEQLKEVLNNKNFKDKLIRPANYKKLANRKLGEGYKIISVNKKKIAIINLMGDLFMKGEGEKLKLTLPEFDKIYKKLKSKKITTILVDMHAEATSQKLALGYYADGRASLVWGTHTHVPTADIKILPKGTGYITDLGMTGLKHSVLGINIESAIASQQKNGKMKKDIPEIGEAIIQGIYVEIDKGKTIKIKQVLEDVSIA